MRKRTIIIAALLLAAGAIVNVAVAWGCAAQPRVGLATVVMRNAYDMDNRGAGYFIVHAGFPIQSTIFTQSWSPQRFNQRKLLPTRPIWPGFAINTVFYAFILWLLFAAPFALRRRRRMKRGLCPECAYPRGASDVCTECGAAVRARPERGEGM